MSNLRLCFTIAGISGVAHHALLVISCFLQRSKSIEREVTVWQQEPIHSKPGFGRAL